MKYFLPLFFIMTSFLSLSQVKGIGINTDDPQQALHLAGTQSTIRVDGLSQLNPLNTGDVNGDGDLTNDTFPLYVNQEGVFALDFNPFFISEDLDAIPVARTITLGQTEATREEEIYSVVIEVPRTSVIEIRYNLGFQVFADSNGREIRDFLARRITTYFTVDNILPARRYGIDSKNFTNRDLTLPLLATNNTGSKGNFFNVGSAYISIPSGGTYTLRIFGEVSSGNGATEHLDTSVIFASGLDSLLYRIY